MGIEKYIPKEVLLAGTLATTGMGATEMAHAETMAVEQAQQEVMMRVNERTQEVAQVGARLEEYRLKIASATSETKQLYQDAMHGTLDALQHIGDTGMKAYGVVYDANKSNLVPYDAGVQKLYTTLAQFESPQFSDPLISHGAALEIRSRPFAQDLYKAESAKAETSLDKLLYLEQSMNQKFDTFKSEKDMEVPQWISDEANRLLENIDVATLKTSLQKRSPEQLTKLRDRFSIEISELLTVEGNRISQPNKDKATAVHSLLNELAPNS